LSFGEDYITYIATCCPEKILANHTSNPTGFLLYFYKFFETV